MKKRKMRSILWSCGALLVVAALIAVPFLMERHARAVRKGPSILTALAERADVQRELCGTGTLKAQEPFSVDVPEGVKITELLVENGQPVQTGDALARVDALSVMNAVTQVQDTLQTLNEQLEEASAQETSSELKAVTGGRLMKCFGGPGDSVQSVMLEHGALAIMSLDGLLSVGFETDAGVSTGDKVNVILPDGTKLEGRVDSALAGKVRVTVSDELAPYGASVRVTDARGSLLGAGDLQAHSEWRAAAYSGSIEEFTAEEGTLIDAGQTIIRLSGQTENAEFLRLSAKHRVYEELMTELFRLYGDRTVYAAHGGIVTLPEDRSAYMLSSGAEEYSLHLLVNAPNGDDETGYINFAGLVSEVGENGPAFLLRPMPVQVEDYLQIEIDREELTVPAQNPIPPETPVFAQEEGEWRQMTLSELAAGDVVLFAYTMTSPDPVWIVRVEKGGSQEPPPAEPTEPKPEDPQEPPTDPGTTPNLPFDPSNYPNLPSNYLDLLPESYAGMLAGQPDYGSYAQSALFAQYANTPMEQEVKTLYSEAKTELMTVTPTDEMTLEIALDEQDILLAEPGQQAEVTLDALPGRSFPAVVTEIDPKGVNSGGSSKFKVSLRLARTGDMLGGMNAQALIPLETYEDVLTIPVSALVEQGARTYVYRAYDQKTGLQGLTEVTTGICDAERVQILSGLQENDPVWYEYYDEMEISNKVDTGPQGYFH